MSLKWIVRSIAIGADILFMWVIVIVCVGGACYSIYQVLWGVR